MTVTMLGTLWLNGGLYRKFYHFSFDFIDWDPQIVSDARLAQAESISNLTFTFDSCGMREKMRLYVSVCWCEIPWQCINQSGQLSTQLGWIEVFLCHFTHNCDLQFREKGWCSPKGVAWPQHMQHAPIDNDRGLVAKRLFYHGQHHWRLPPSFLHFKVVNWVGIPTGCSLNCAAHAVTDAIMPQI